MSTIPPLSEPIAWHPVAVAAQLPKRSKLLAKEVKEGKIKIVAAKYDLEDGKVTLLK